MRAQEFIRESSVPPQVQQVIDELTADDVGSEDFGEYVLRFEGFSDWCQSDALERCELPAGDPRKLSAYEDVYQEVLDGWNSEMHSAPVAQGFAGSEDYPVQWALYRKPVVTEIERLKARDYEGGKDEIEWQAKRRAGLTPLPGGSGLLYNVQGNKHFPMIVIWDPNGPDAQPGRPQPIGKLSLDSAERILPIKGALQVGSITVDEDYRGQGIARSLYGIVLSVMRRPLVAGDSQTPGGRQNWISLGKIPGVEVRGWVAIYDAYLDPNYAPDWETKAASKKIRVDAEKMIDTLMGQLGAEYIGKSGINNHVFAFDVRPGRSEREFEAVIKTELSRVYNEPANISTGLYAVWTGA